MVVTAFAAFGGVFKEIDEANWIPFIVGSDLFGDEVGVAGEERDFNFPDDAIVGGMFADAPEPIARVHVVGFAAVKNAVKQTAILVFDVLGDCMRGFEMIVPEQDGGMGEFACQTRGFGFGKCGLNLCIDFGDGHGGGARLHGHVRRFGGIEQSEDGRHGIGSGDGSHLHRVDHLFAGSDRADNDDDLSGAKKFLFDEDLKGGSNVDRGFAMRKGHDDGDDAPIEGEGLGDLGRMANGENGGVMGTHP